MTNNLDVLQLTWTAILLLAGGILFWIGAFIPPWKQWMTSDLKEYLTIINKNRINWYFIHVPMIFGVLLTLFALQIFAGAGSFSSSGKIFSSISASAFSLGAILLIINFAFRFTVTMWAANRLAETGTLETWFRTWMDWSNVLFMVYMILAYLSIGFWGLALKDIPIMPSWSIWFCVIFGFVGAVGYLVRLPFFAPPLIIHLPFIVLSITLLIKLKTAPV